MVIVIVTMIYSAWHSENIRVTRLYQSHDRLTVRDVVARTEEIPTNLKDTVSSPQAELKK